MTMDSPTTPASLPQRCVSEPRPGILGVPPVETEADDGSNYPAAWAAGLHRKS